jgi:hypothetical protein
MGTDPPTQDDRRRVPAYLAAVMNRRHADFQQSRPAGEAGASDTLDQRQGRTQDPSLRKGRVVVASQSSHATPRLAADGSLRAAAEPDPHARARALPGRASAMSRGPAWPVPMPLRQTMPFGQRNPLTEFASLACPLGLLAHDSGLRADGSLIAWYANQ